MHRFRNLLYLVLVVGLVSMGIRKYHEYERTGGWHFSASEPHSSTITLTTEWSEVKDVGIGTGLIAGWRMKDEDVAYVVEYIGTEYGTVSETIPPRKGRAKNWKPEYPHIAATGARFRLPDDSWVPEADLRFSVHR